MATQLSEAPDKAGVARIEFKQQYITRRQGDTITLGFKFDWVYAYSLMDGEQLLIDRRLPGFGVIFCGTDEAPFITEIPRIHLDILRNDGEEAFYASLMPPHIHYLEGVFGSGRAVRQGDIWAYPLPSNWDEMAEYHRNHSSLRHFLSRSGKLQILGSRHMLHGRWAEDRKVLVDSPAGQMAIARPHRVVEGTLKAPDHADRQLEGPHSLARGPRVMRPVPIRGGD